MSLDIRLWSCSAQCQDGVEREVLGLYRGDSCLLISRYWISLSPGLQAELGQRFLLLQSLVSVADYSVHDGVWHGDIATDWRALAALTGHSHNTIAGHLTNLSNAGFIHRRAGSGAAKSSLIRIYPHNRETGRRQLQIEPSWLRAFISSVQPRVALAELVVKGKNNTEIKPLAKPQKQVTIAQIVQDAPIIISALQDPKSWGNVAEKKINTMLLNGIAGIKEVEHYWRIAQGMDPDLSIHNKDFVAPESGVKKSEVDPQPGVRWHNQVFEAGIEVIATDEIRAPLPTDIGVSPIWDLAVGKGGPHFLAPEVGVSMQEAKETLESSHLSICPPLAPKSGANGAPAFGGAAAPASPPPAAPPSASAHFVRPRSERQLSQEQLDGLYQLRGQRVPDKSRLSLSLAAQSCINAYERLAGVPFCRDDMKYLDKALTATSHSFVLRAIRDCAVRWPEDSPGYYLVREGFARVAKTIDDNKFLQVSAKKSRVKVTSGMSDTVSKEVRRRREEKKQKIKAQLQANGKSPNGTIVTSTAPAAAPAPAEEKKTWP
jgi:hypothetical protein